MERFDTINRELERHNPKLLEKPQIVVLSKSDVTEVREQADAIAAIFSERGFKTLLVSAVTGDGLEGLVALVAKELSRLRSGEEYDEFGPS